MAGVMQHSGEALRPDPDGSGARVVGLDLIPAKILVVDDDQRNLFAVEEMLRAPGIEIVLADSGEAALRRVLQDDFAVILLDVQMPRIDGYEVASLIRARPRSSRVPIIFLTAFNKDDLHVFRGYTAGAVDYVFKPNRRCAAATSTSRWCCARCRSRSTRRPRRRITGACAS